jgi:tetratricopeptide (TPR) repeat protein
MQDFNVTDVNADVKRAIEKQNNASGNTVFEMLQPSAPNASKYWLYVAYELHRQGMFYEELECWREGEKYLGDDSFELELWYQDKIDTLINAQDQTNDRFFGELALAAAETLIANNESESALNAKLQLIQELKPERALVLNCIEHILDKGFDVEVPLQYLKLGINSGYELDQIKNYRDLAECHFWAGDISEAMRIWSKAVKDDPDNESLCSAIYWLVRHADNKKLDAEKFLPEEFGKLDS